MLQSKDIIDVLRNDEAKSFIREHINDHFAELSLSYRGKVSFNLTVCLQLMEVYRKARTKMPLVWDHFLAIDKRSYEQSTAQEVAEFKSTFIQGKQLIDLTAGWGMDAIALSRNFESVIGFERNPELHMLADYNLEVLGITNMKRICNEAKIDHEESYDWVYIDPDRRVHDKRAVSLEEMEPPVLEMLPLLQRSAHHVYIKLSPLFDLDEVFRTFTHIEAVHCIAFKGEVKEVGVLLNFKKETDDVPVVLTDVGGAFRYETTFRKRFATELVSADLHYINLPHALLLKARVTDDYLSSESVFRHPDFQIYYSERAIILPGVRSFRIIGRSGWSVKEIRSMLKLEAVDQVNIVIKGEKVSPASWHKKLKTRDGGDLYLFLLNGKVRESFFCELVKA